MNMQLVSDLHLDLYPLWQRVLEDDVCAYNKDVDVLIVPGDTAEVNSYEWLAGYEFLAQHYPRVIGVLGNHEHFGSDLELVKEKISQLPPNVSILRREACVVDGITFAGTTLWYPKNYRKIDREGYPDFLEIPGGESWILDENERDVAFLRLIEKADIVITHQAPSFMSVEKRFIGSAINAFFVCNMENLILKRSFSYWFHGHMHRSSNYQIGQTQVQAAPRGYRSDVVHYSPVVIEYKKASG